MCQRYTITASTGTLRTRFNVVVPDAFEQRYNAAPTQILPVITNQNPGGFSLFHWGLISNLAKNKSISLKLINTRAETLEEKTPFRNALRFRRCLVPADGFYEWKTLGKKTRVPYRIVLGKGEIFSFAGLWEEFEDNEGEMNHSFTIITVPAYAPVSQIHHRVPAMLTKDKEQLWLDDSLTDEEHLQLLQPVDSSKINMFTVSPKVNNLKHDSPSLIEHAPPADQFGNYTLFG